MRIIGSRAILAVSGRVGKKWGQRSQSLYNHMPALFAETRILQVHVHVAGKEAHHARLFAPEVVWQGATLLEVVAACGTEPGRAPSQFLCQPGVRSAQQCQPLP